MVIYESDPKRQVGLRRAVDELKITHRHVLQMMDRDQRMIRHQSILQCDRRNPYLDRHEASCHQVKSEFASQNCQVSFKTPIFPCTVFNGFCSLLQRLRFQY